MNAAHQQSVRALRLAMIATGLLALALFVCSAVIGYVANQRAADTQVRRTTDIAYEHAVKVFETVDSNLTLTAEILRGLSDSAIIADEERLHNRLNDIVESRPQVKSLWAFDVAGNALVNSLSYPSQRQNFADRDYFKSHLDRGIGTYIGETLLPRPPYHGGSFFGISRRRLSDDGAFIGVLQASVLPEYFLTFYRRISAPSAQFFALVRADGKMLVRYPQSDKPIVLRRAGHIAAALDKSPDEGLTTILSPADGIERRIAYRRLADYPVYVASGLETAAIRAQWLADVSSQLIFGLPATLAILALFGLALRRTNRMYAEAGMRLQAEDALRHAERVTALGQLAGGVAHDFNNVLMVIRGAMRKLSRDESAEGRASALDMLEQAAAQGEGLAQQLLTLGRKQSAPAAVVDVGSEVAQFLRLAKRSFRGNIALDVTRAMPGCCALLDVNELRMAVLNLAVNAQDAMPDGGAITAAVRRDGDSIVMTFADAGGGIPDTIRDRIFEPFFTTKDSGRGTGLGLAQVKSFVDEAGGTIALTSGSGATFTITLPACDAVSAGVIGPSQSLPKSA